MRVLITRPGDDSASLADALRRCGIESVSEPLLTIRFLDGTPLDLAGVQAVLLTSANGSRAIARRTERRDVPVYTVGDATARSAREADFETVHSADGDVEALATLVRERLDPAKGALLHAAGSEVAGDLGGRLGEAGFSYRREVLYEAETAHSLSPSAVAAIKEARIDAVLVYSPRTADTLGRLVRKARLVRDCRAIDLLCLSQAVVDAATDLPWKSVRIASQPTQDAMVALASELATIEPVPSASTTGSPPQPTAPPPRRAARTIFMTLLVIAALAGLAAATAPLWRPELARYLPMLAEQPEAAQRIDALTERLAALEGKSPASAVDLATLQAERDRLQARLSETFARLDKLEAAIESVRQSAARATQGGDDAAAREALRQVGERLAEVERTRLGADADAAQRIDRLARQVDALEKIVPPREDAETIRQARLVFAVGRLRDAVQSTQPFTMELAALQSLTADDPEFGQALQRLAPHAESGVPSLDAIRERFKSVARETVNASRIPEGDGWLERSLARIMRAVNVRRTDDLEGSDVESIVARAERALARPDVRQAIVELRHLPENITPLARRWLADADAYVAANRALVDLQTRAFAALGGERAK